MALRADIGMACNMFVRFSNTALPKRKKTLSGIPIATFQRFMIIKSTIVAIDPTIIEKMRVGLYFQPLINV